MPEGGPFGTLAVDPPWHYGATNDRSSAGKHYPTMRNAEIAALPFGEWAAANAHLYLWVTNPRLFGERGGCGPSPLEMLERWGFRYVTMLTWHKTGAPGMGYYYRGDTEHVLMGVRGKAPVAPALRLSNFFAAPKRRHSEKPSVFFERVERVSPAGWLECFARRRRSGWSAWGNETGALDDGQGDLL